MSGPRPSVVSPYEAARHRWRRVHRCQLRPPDRRGTARRPGHGPRRADVRRQPGLARRGRRSHRLRARRHRRRRHRQPPGGRFRRRRAFRGRVAQRQLASRPLAVRAHQRRGHVHAAAGRARPRRPLPPHLDRRGVRRPRAGRSGSLHRGHRLQPVQSLLVDEGVERHAGAGLDAIVRDPGDAVELLQQLRPLPTRGEVHSAADHQPARRRPPQALRAGPQCARLDPRRRPQPRRVDRPREGADRGDVPDRCGREVDNRTVIAMLLEIFGRSADDFDFVPDGPATTCGTRSIRRGCAPSWGGSRATGTSAAVSRRPCSGTASTPSGGVRRRPRPRPDTRAPGSSRSLREAVDPATATDVTR